MYRTTIDDKTYEFEHQVTRSNNDPPKGWVTGTNVYKVTLARIGEDGERHTFTTAYHMGPALTRKPTAEEVVETMEDDRASFHSFTDMVDMAEEYGMTDDVREASRLWNALKNQTERWENFLSH